MHVQVDGVTVPVTPGPECKPAAQRLNSRRRNASPRLVGPFLDGVIWFGIFAAASGFGLLASAIFDDIRTIIGF